MLGIPYPAPAPTDHCTGSRVVTLAVPSTPADADEPAVTATGRHRVVPHRCRTLPAVVLADTVRTLAHTGAAAVNWRPLLAALTVTAAVALFLAMLAEGAEFATGGDVPHLLTTAVLLLALVLYGSRTGTGEGPRSVGSDALFFASIGCSVIQEAVDFWLDREATHIALLGVLVVSTCIYAVRSYTHDRSDS